jgi:hypothetical protein
MAVTARITAKKSNGTESIVDRQSPTTIFLDAGNGIDRVSVIIRADGRISIEVRNGQSVTQYLNLTRGYTTHASGTIFDGVAR